MSRKKWTARTEVNDSLLKFREKRKWQIALRRYVLEQRWSTSYAPYFGIDMGRFRSWIELQFEEGMAWENFSKVWQFDHIVPVAYFDFGVESDLRLCWNFTNIRVENLAAKPRLDVLAAKSHFKALHERTGYAPCGNMVKKIEALEASLLEGAPPLERFLTENKPLLQTISSFSDYEYLQLNEGISLDKILEERAFRRDVSR